MSAPFGVPPPPRPWKRSQRGTLPTGSQLCPPSILSQAQSWERGGHPFNTRFPLPLPPPTSPLYPPQNLTLPKKNPTFSLALLFLANLRLLCLSSPPSLPPLHLPPSLSLGGKKVIAQMISQSSVAVATGCWNWDRRAARTTERSSISQGWGSPAFVFAFKSRGAGRCGAPSSTPRTGPLHRQPPTAWLRFIKLSVSRCHHGVSTASASLGVAAPSFTGGALFTNEEASALGRAAVELGHIVVSSPWLRRSWGNACRWGSGLLVLLQHPTREI